MKRIARHKKATSANFGTKADFNESSETGFSIGTRHNLVKCTLICLGATIGIGILVVLALFSWDRDFVIKDFPETITVTRESGYTPSYGEVCFGNDFSCDREVEVSQQGEVNPEKAGEYTIQYNFSYGKKVKTLEQHVVVADEEAPVITLNGEVELTITVGTSYQDAGATATDNLDTEVAVSQAGKVDVNTAGDYKINYTATDVAGNTATAERIVHVIKKTTPISTPKSSGWSGPVASKVVYLTFDDGPSEYTANLLDVLKKYNAKASFFVTCRGSDAMIKREYDEGHTVALHTCSHDYAQIYASEEAFSLI